MSESPKVKLCDCTDPDSFILGTAKGGNHMYMSVGKISTMAFDILTPLYKCCQVQDCKKQVILKIPRCMCMFETGSDLGF